MTVGDAERPRKPLVQTTFLDPLADARARLHRARAGVRAATSRLVLAVREWRAATEHLRDVMAREDAGREESREN